MCVPGHGLVSDAEKENILGLAARNACFGNYLSILDGKVNGGILKSNDRVVPSNPNDFKAKQLRGIYVALAYKYFVSDFGKDIDLNAFGSELMGFSRRTFGV